MCETMRNFAKPAKFCEIMQNFAKLYNNSRNFSNLYIISRNYTKFCETIQNFANFKILTICKVLQSFVKFHKVLRKLFVTVCQVLRN